MPFVKDSNYMRILLLCYGDIAPNFVLIRRNRQILVRTLNFKNDGDLAFIVWQVPSIWLVLLSFVLEPKLFEGCQLSNSLHDSGLAIVEAKRVFSLGANLILCLHPSSFLVRRRSHDGEKDSGTHPLIVSYSTEGALQDTRKEYKTTGMCAPETGALLPTRRSFLEKHCRAFQWNVALQLCKS